MRNPRSQPSAEAFGTRLRISWSVAIFPTLSMSTCPCASGWTTLGGKESRIEKIPRFRGFPRNPTPVPRPPWGPTLVPLWSHGHLRGPPRSLVQEGKEPPEGQQSMHVLRPKRPLCKHVSREQSQQQREAACKRGDCGFPHSGDSGSRYFSATEQATEANQGSCIAFKQLVRTSPQA
jgi:hypothetical protein